MATINFDDKVALNENPNVPDINKCKDTDLNLIKQVGNQTINTLGLYTDNWSSTGTYTIGDIVIDDNRYFKNITGTNTATEPKNDTMNWEETTIILNEQSSSQINTYSCNYINGLINALYNVLYPVGTIIIKADNNDYSNWLGFTWERTLVGRVAVGIDSTQTEFDTIGETGGEKKHTLTVNEMPSHYHNRIRLVEGNQFLGEGGGSNYNVAGLTLNTGKYVYTDDVHNNVATSDTGGGQAHNILQPYQVVAYWKRTA